MTITLQPPAALAAVAPIGEVIPEGIVRIYQAMGAHNPTANPVTLTIHLVPEAGVADTSNRILNRAVPAGKTDICLELIGRGLRKGGRLHAGGAGLNFGYTALDTEI